MAREVLPQEVTVAAGCRRYGVGARLSLRGVITSVYGTNMVCVRSGGVYAAMGIAKRSVLP